MAAQAALPTPVIYDPAGVNVTLTHTTPQFKLGSVARGADGQEYTYCLSSGSIALGALVAIDEGFVARGATSTNAALASGPGWPQVAFADGVYGWVATRGRKLYGKQKDGTAADAQLFTSTSVGIMGSTGSAGGPHMMIAGTRNVALTSGAGAAYEICAVNPHFISPYAALA
jgi:hypothetical protein